MFMSRNRYKAELDFRSDDQRKLRGHSCAISVAIIANCSRYLELDLLSSFISN